MDLKDYKLVWSDEFDENSIGTKWSLSDIMGTTRNAQGKLTYDSQTGERVAKVEDGLLKLNVYYDEERDTFVGPMSIHTKDSMSFVYGYVEMRARLPYTHGAWGSLWALGRDAIGQDKTQPYFAEVDIFEIDGSSHVAVPNLHKWHYRDRGFVEEGKNHHDAAGLSIRSGGTPDSTLIGHYTPEKPEDFNIYGFLWTPEKMEMYINGNLYGRFDMVNDFARPSDLAPFHSPIYLIMNNYLAVDGYAGIGDSNATCLATKEDVVNQIPYEIDYIRLYQKEGEGKLNLAE